MSKKDIKLTVEDQEIKSASGTVLQDTVKAKTDETKESTVKTVQMSEQEIGMEVKKRVTKVQLALGLLDSYEYAILPGNPEEDGNSIIQFKASTFLNDDRTELAADLLADYKEIKRLLSL